MRIVLSVGGRRRAVDVDAVPDATVADLARAAGEEPGARVTVAGRDVPTDHTLVEAAVPDGAEVTVGPARQTGGSVAARPRAATGAPPGASARRPQVEVVTGLDAGVRLAVDGPVVVGRAHDADLRLDGVTVGARHCRLDPGPDGGLLVTELGGTNATLVDGVPVDGTCSVPVGGLVACGAVLLRHVARAPDDRVRDLDPVRHLGAGRGVPFNRPPRAGAAPGPAAVALPAPAAPAVERPRMPWLALVVPLLLGGVLVATTGSWRFAVFLVLGPVLLLGTTVTQRRTHTRDARRAARERATALDRFAQGLAAAVRHERARRWGALPSPGEVLRRAAAPSTAVWERRPVHPDMLRLVAGVGDVAWDPPADAGPRGADDPAVTALLAAHAVLPRTPVAVELADGGVVGVVGDPAAARSFARWLVAQACTHQGPADLALAVVADPAVVGAWWWTGWLPHAHDPFPGAGPGDRLLAVAGDDGAVLLDALVAQGVSPDGVDARDRTLLLVLDAPEHLRGPAAPARALLRGSAGPVAGIVVAATADRLPAVCDTVVHVDEDGVAEVLRPAERGTTTGVLVAGLRTATAARLARSLAGLADPELDGVGSELPTRVDLVDLLHVDLLHDDGRAATVRSRTPGRVPTAADLAAGWSARGAEVERLVTPLGVGAAGPLHVDLVADGPHALLGGTTGAGKSELLRSLVAGLAARYGPDRCTFLLVDYKGGAAFDACAALPHVVGVVTDLDEHLAARALRCLEAELVHRERRLRDAGVGDIVQWGGLPDERRGPPLPRLVVVVDEFATLRAELPGFVTSLVGVAQRGRSLGVHLVLGTQRPAGAVSEDVRANTNLRIALRVTDPRDGTDVVGVPDPAAIPPDLPGRGVLRIGQGVPARVQTALVTGRGGPDRPAVRLHPVTFGRRPGAAVSTVTGAAGPGAGACVARADVGAGDVDEGSRTTTAAPSDLEQLVEACRGAAGLLGVPAPRRPWTDPLPGRLALEGLLASDDPAVGSSVLPMALADRPEHQDHRVAGWDLADGNLLVHGTVGAGTTTTLAAAVLAAAHQHAPDELHVHVLDLGRGALAPLAGLPHVGSVVTAAEEERRTRLLRMLVDEAARRRGLSGLGLAAEPRLVVVVDGLATLLAELDTPMTHELADAVVRLLAEAPGLRISCALGTDRVGGLRSALTATVAQRWAHRLADPGDLALLGLRPADVPDLPPGRAVRATDGRVVQVGCPGDLAAAVAAAAGRWPGAPSRQPVVVGTLPTSTEPALLQVATCTTEHVWRLAVGVRDDDLAAAVLGLHRGEHALVLGPPSSGRSGLLRGLADRVVALGGADVVVVAGAASSPLVAAGHRCVPPAALGDELRALAAGRRPTLVLVDDAERVPDPGPVLAALGGDGPRVHVVAAARADVLRADLVHWARRVARSRRGVLLRPADLDAADLLGVRPPRRTPAPAGPGRGWLVADDRVGFAQFDVEGGVDG